MPQTILTHSQMVDWKVDGFVQLDLFPEELEEATRKADLIYWSNYVNLKELELDFKLDQQ